ncbi:MAG: MBL fold metallo-hydrolase [Chitinophagales bacterium]|nr:MBL fold metallo-hydrolase [Chitinophagales bacterium]
MEKVAIQLVRNATLKIQYAGKVLLVDPMLSSRHSFMSFVEPGKDLNPTVGLPMSVEEVIEGVDAVLLTHLHPDHFDQKAMEVLAKDLPFYVQPSDKEMVEKADFTNVEAIESMANYDPIKILRTDGKHGPDKLLPTLGIVSGFVLQAENWPTIYIIGDCLWDETIERQIEKYNPDIIITNSGGAIFMGQDRILMNEEETLKVARKAPQAQLIATHIEALDHCQVTREALAKAAAEANLPILIPDDGETIIF